MIGEPDGVVMLVIYLVSVAQRIAWCAYQRKHVRVFDILFINGLATLILWTIWNVLYMVTT